MHGSDRASATSICEALRKTLRAPGTEKERLGFAAALLEERLGVQAAFCEIMGSRWSHLSGHAGLLTPRHRISLSPRLGLLTGEIPETVDDWDIVIDCLRGALSEPSV